MESSHRKVTVKYYGMLAERLHIESEVLHLPSGEIQLRDFLIENHPELAQFTFTAAVDLEYTDTLSKDVQPQKIDIMPPFAGG